MAMSAFLQRIAAWCRSRGGLRGLLWGTDSTVHRVKLQDDEVHDGGRAADAPRPLPGKWPENDDVIARLSNR